MVVLTAAVEKLTLPVVNTAAAMMVVMIVFILLIFLMVDFLSCYYFLNTHMTAENNKRYGKKWRNIPTAVLSG